MRVGIDAHMVGGLETGNESYVRGLVEALGAMANTDLDLVVYHLGRPWSEPSRGVSFRRLASGNPAWRLGWELPVRSARDGLDLLHVTYATPLWSRARLAVTVHDISFASHPEWFSSRDLRVLSTFVPRSLRSAARVITVSEWERDRIVERYGVPERKISAIHNGPGAAAQPISDADAKAELQALGMGDFGPYLLAVGNLQPRKNLIRLMRAFEASRAGSDLRLVVVGPRRHRGGEVLAAAVPLGERVHFTGYVSDRQLAACYSHCTAFVFPSLYEAFGLPAIEAMAHGVPVACSNAGALPEICADAALMFDPLSTEAMAAAIQAITTDTAVRDRLSAAGPVRARQFSWAKSATLTYEAYQKALA
ncbi:MAG TPA: glycosyltransferase family 1 protein [Candidatus Dormibacteraeota bacterium]|nr:glycosyltransferase family 1 protein [Candidatus Dormibacteraeota bacterium]